jgi:molecular chaperone HtpG
VFIADENVDLVPHYLRFLRGVIDSEDLPLNVSRETLQHNPVIEKIKQSVTNKVLGEMKKKLNEDFASYKEFWDIFGQVFKEGLCEGGIDKEKILSLCLFKSALSDEEITLDQYIQNAKAKQKQIFFLSGEDAEKLKKSPQIEGFISKGIDVLLFVDPVDDFWVSVADGYKEFEFKSVTRNEVDIESILDETELNTNEPNTTPDKEDNKNEEELAVEYFKSILDDKVKDVKISKKLVSSPVCLVSGAMGMDLRMERFLLEQKQLHKSSKKILEINPKNNIIQKILKIKDDNKELAEKLVLTLFDQACILEGEPVSDLSLFRERLNDIITLAL